MVLYSCDKCGYSTNHKHNYIIDCPFSTKISLYDTFLHRAFQLIVLPQKGTISKNFRKKLLSQGKYILHKHGL